MTNTPLPSGPWRRLAPSLLNPEPVAGDQDCFRFLFSDESVARDGHVIISAGIETDNYLRNPVVPWAHDTEAPPIGRSVSLSMGASCFVNLKFVPREISPFAGMIRDMVAGSWLRAVSMSWMPIDWRFSTDRERGPGAIDFLSCDLLEISVVPVPALATALIDAAAHGLDTAPMREWTERMLDTRRSLAVPRTELEQLHRSAIMAKPPRRAASDWKCGAATDLPISDTEDWDGPAAAKAILDAAAGDDGAIDPAKAKGGFLLYDAGDPGKRGSYKEPFATLIDGKLTATKGGVKAAASRLPQVEGVPQDATDKARKVLDGYEEKLGMGEAARSVIRAPVGKRDLYDVSWLAWLLMDLGSLQECVAEEAAREGDGSPLPDMLTQALQLLGQTLVAMSAEEVGELLSTGEEEEDQELGLETAPRAARALRRGLVVLLRQAAGQPMARKGAAAVARMDSRSIAVALRHDMLSPAGMRAVADLIETRSGRVLSSDNEATLRTAHDCMTRACDLVRGVFEQVEDDGATPPPEDNDDGNKTDSIDGGTEADRAAAARRRRQALVAQIQAQAALA